MDAILKRIRRNADNGILLGLLAFVLIVMSFSSRRFLTPGFFQSIAFQLPEMGILTLSMMVPMVTGGINLACIATANLSGIMMASWMTALIPAGTDNPALVLGIVLAGIAACTLISLGNGVIIAYFKVPPILATLSTQIFLNGACTAITRGKVISGFPDSFQKIGNGTVSGIPVPLLLFVVCAVIMAVILRYLPFGSRIYMYGSNATATEFSGVNPKHLILKVYALSGFFIGVASVLLISRFNSAAAGYAVSYLLQSVLIAVLGGISPNGGTGKISGLVLAVLIFQVVASGLNILRVSQYLTMALYGIILLAAVALRSRGSSR